MSKLHSLLKKGGSGQNQPKIKNGAEISDAVRQAINADNDEDKEPEFLSDDEQVNIEEELTEELNEPGESETIKGNIEEEVISDNENVDIDKELEKSENDANNSPSSKYGVFISGKMLLGMTDTVFPTLVLTGAKIAKIKHDKKREDLVLTEDEKEIAEPLADKVVEELFEKFTPLQQFFIVMGTFYGSKLTDTKK